MSTEFKQFEPTYTEANVSGIPGVNTSTTTTAPSFSGGNYKQYEPLYDIPTNPTIDQIGSNAVVTNGELHSRNYVRGKHGWSLSDDGRIDAQDFLLAGRIITVGPDQSIQSAIDLVSQSGGGEVLLRPGNYIITSSIDLADNVSLIGTTNPQGNIVNLVMVGTAQLRLVGTSKTSAGTVSCTQGTQVVTRSASGADWLTTVVAGDQIRINGFWYEIYAVAANDTLIITSPLSETSVSGVPYLIANTKSNISVENITLIGSSSSVAPLQLQYATYTTFKSITIALGGANGIDIDDSAHFSLKVFRLVGNTGDGVNITNGSYLVFDEGYAASNTGDGIDISGSQSTTISFNNCVVRGNAGNGVKLDDVQDISVAFSDISFNVGDGINVSADAVGVKINTNKIKSNYGYGIKNSNTTGTPGSSITNNTFTTNVSGTTDYTGSNVLIRGNIGLNDNSTYSTVVTQLTKNYTAGESLSVGDLTYIYPVENNTNSHTINLVSASSQYLYAADSVSLSITGSMTIELWVYLSSAPSSGQTYELVNKYDETGNQQSYGLFYNNNAGTPRLVYFVSSGGASNVELAKNNTIPTSTWTHVAVTYTAGTGTAEFFINGASIGTTAGGPASIFDSTANFKIGARATPSVGGYFDGYIDDVRVWNAVRSTANINYYKNKTLVGTETNLKAYWKLDNSLSDTTANANTLTNSGSATFQSSSLPFTGGDVYKTNSSITGAYESTIGFNTTAVSGGQTATIAVSGETTVLSGLTRGSIYYVSSVDGGITTSSAAPSRKIGIATSSSSLLITNIP